ncbi:uncharacterized protein TNCV_1586491 [Trichonephila clavipes]|nr:uncharacterized protein TNCV_1586491 [Trichonephila clavipes]
MDLPPPVSQKSYKRTLRKINLASREVADDLMKNAAKEEVSASGSNEICVSGDGCEKWRGSKFGHSYQEWKLKHHPHCVNNHIESSSKMEVYGTKEIFQRSVPRRNAKYINYIGDGDTKTFPELQRTVPYSSEKVECVGHIQKRMGARVRKLKTMNRGKKLSDGPLMRSLCITSSQLVILRGANIKRQLLQIVLLHSNKNTVPIAIMNELKPIIAELSAPKLLKKCVGVKRKTLMSHSTRLFGSNAPKLLGHQKYCRHSSK